MPMNPGQLLQGRGQQQGGIGNILGGLFSQRRPMPSFQDNQAQLDQNAWKAASPEEQDKYRRGYEERRKMQYQNQLGNMQDAMRQRRTIQPVNPSNMGQAMQYPMMRPTMPGPSLFGGKMSAGTNMESMGTGSRSDPMLGRRSLSSGQNPLSGMFGQNSGMSKVMSSIGPIMQLMGMMGRSMR